MTKYKDYFWRAPTLDVYRIGVYYAAPNLTALYMNGTPIYVNCYKSGAIAKLREIKGDIFIERKLKYYSNKLKT